MDTITMDMPAHQRHLFRPLLILLAGVGALLILGIAVAVLSTRQPETTFPAGSPESAVTTYLRLLQSGQVDNAFAMTASPCPHLETLYGENSHHIAESGFKALARALRMAVELDPKTAGSAPSTKGVL